MSDFDLGRGFLDHEPTPIRAEHDPAPAVAFRPYLLTGGQTESDLAYETLVWATDTIVETRQPEQDAIVAAAATPVAVAEIAALTNLPIGVARVMIDELITRGALTAGETPNPDAASDGDIALVERIIAGLQTTT